MKIDNIRKIINSRINCGKATIDASKTSSTAIDDISGAPPGAILKRLVSTLSGVSQ